MEKGAKLKIAAIGDTHVRDTSKGHFQDLFSRISKEADVLVLCGDLTNYGMVSEAEILAGELTSCTIPVVAVLGNHDYHSGKQDKVREILQQTKVHMLDVEPIEIEGVAFAGAKGFIGGFDERMLGAFGEDTIKHIVDEAVKEALHLETSLSQFNTERKVAVLHYSPVVETLEGEAVEILPFLGSTRLEEPIDHLKVSVVFHGHAHYGKHEGKTKSGIPVFNCAMPILEKINPGSTYKVFEV